VGSFLYQAPQSFSYSWTLNGSPIAGATTSMIDANAVGQYACAVVATNHAGSATQTSLPHTIAATSPPPTIMPPPPTITPPKPTITQLKAKVTSAKHTARFTFEASAVAAGTQCALIRQNKHHKYPKPQFKSCKSPTVYKHLKAGRYTFEVRAVNTAGAGSATTKSFKII
jgi:hypothetical protein